MSPSPFVQHAPRSVDEAIAVLAEHGHDAKVLAGGQSLIPILNMRPAAPGHLVDINGVAGLDTVEVTPTAVHIGALVRHAQLERDAGAFAQLPLLRLALLNVAHPVIRNGVVAGGTKESVVIHAAASDILRDSLRAQRSGQEPFFDRGPGYAELSGGATSAAVDWL